MASQRTSVQVECPGCQTPNVIERWDVVNLAVDRAARALISRHQLSSARCIRCARWIRLPGTLLVFIPPPDACLVFSSTLNHEQTSEERGNLIGTLSDVLATEWDEAYLKSGIIIDRHLLAVLLDAGSQAAAGLRAALIELVNARSPELIRQILAAQPLLWSAAAPAALEALTDAQASEVARARGNRVVAQLRDWQASRGDGANTDVATVAAAFETLHKAVSAGEASPQIRALAVAKGELLRRLIAPQEPQWLTLWLANQLTDWRGDDPAAHQERGITMYLDALDRVADIATDRAAVFRDLGIAFHQRLDGNRAGNIERAIAYYDRALQDDGDPDTQVLTLCNRSAAFADRMLGDRADNVEQAIRDLARARTIPEAQRNPDRFAHLMHSLGVLYQLRLTGVPILNSERARWSFEIALEHWRPENTLARAQTSATLAGILVNRQVDPEFVNLKRASELSRSALKGLTPEQHPAEFLGAAVNFGLSLAAAGGRSLGRAIRIVSWALTKTAGIRASPQWAHGMTQLAFLYGRRADRGNDTDVVEQAVQALHTALDVYTQSGSRDECLKCHRDLGNLLFRHRRWQDAAAAYERAEALENLGEHGFTRPSQLTTLKAAAKAGTRQAYALALSGRLDEAVTTLERFRARELRETLGRRHPDLLRLRGVNPSLHQHFTEAVAGIEQLRAAERQRSLGDTQGRENAAPDQSAQAHQRAKRAVDETLAAIHSTPGFERFFGQPTLADVHDVVQPERPLAYLVATDSGTVVLLLRRGAHGVDTVAVRDDDLTTSRIQRLLVAWPSGGERGEGYFELTEPDASEPNKVAVQWRGELPEGGYLVAQIREPRHLPESVRATCETFAPLMKRVAEFLDWSELRYLVLIPTGKLGLLPIHAALPTAFASAAPAQAVAYAPSAAVLATLRVAEKREAEQAPTLVGVANPLPHPVPLRFAQFELTTIAERFAPHASHVVASFAAKRDAVLQLLSATGDTSGISCLHMACHGKFDMWDPLLSELSLSGGEGIKLIELLDRNLLRDVRLVTLSACQTAITDVNNVPDEVGSLAGGFLAAGATGVVATLWPVDDLACALLFIRFYHLLLNEEGRCATEPPVALALAQQWLRGVSAGELATFFETANHAFEARNGKAYPLLTHATRHFRALSKAAACYADPVHWAGYVYLGA